MDLRFKPKVEEHDYQFKKADTVQSKVETRWGAFVRIVGAGLMAWLAGMLFSALGNVGVPERSNGVGCCPCLVLRDAGPLVHLGATRA